MNSSQKNAGYDQEEKYFHDLNQKLISARREGKTSTALALRPSGKIIPFPKQNTLKKAG